MEGRRYLHFDIDVVARDDALATDGRYLDLYVDNPKRLGADVDVHKARVGGFVELSKTGDQTD